MLAPVAVGLALAAACLAAAFQDDVLGASFGWRQPLGLLSAGAVLLGVLPGVAAVASGRWRTPTLALSSVLGQFPVDPPEGDYRVLWIGDPRVMPVPAWTLGSGVGYAITDDGPLTQYEVWPGRPSKTESEVGAVLAQMAVESTLRGGRLLAPYGIRYVVVPIADGAVSTLERRLPLPNGLIDALDDQLDFAEPLSSPLNFKVYENTAWIPTRAQFTDAETTRQAGYGSLARLELAQVATPVGVGSADNADVGFAAVPGAVTVGTPLDTRWTVRVGGTTVEPRPAFGTTMGFDIATGGAATLTYTSDTSRAAMLIGQLVLWLLLALGVSRFDSSSLVRRRRRRGDGMPNVPLLSMEAPIVAPAADEPLPWSVDAVTDIADREGVE
jgi:hypothetical protein